MTVEMQYKTCPCFQVDGYDRCEHNGSLFDCAGLYPADCSPWDYVQAKETQAAKVTVAVTTNATNVREALDIAHRGEIAIFTYRWNGPVPGRAHVVTITKILCSDRDKLVEWGRRHRIPATWMHIFKEWGSAF